MSRLLYQAELHRRVTTRSRLSTGPAVGLDRASPFTESNRRPSPYHGDALPTELKGRCSGAEETLPSRCRRPADPLGPCPTTETAAGAVPVQRFAPEPMTCWNGPDQRLALSLRRVR